MKVVDLAVAKTFKETVEKPKVPRKALVLLIGNGAGPQVCVRERGRDGVREKAREREGYGVGERERKRGWATHKSERDENACRSALHTSSLSLPHPNMSSTSRRRLHHAAARGF